MISSVNLSLCDFDVKLELRKWLFISAVSVPVVFRVLGCLTNFDRNPLVCVSYEGAYRNVGRGYLKWSQTRSYRTYRHWIRVSTASAESSLSEKQVYFSMIYLILILIVFQVQRMFSPHSVLMS